MSEGKVGCSEKVHDAFGVGFHPCSRVGRVERDGKWYCSQHDPCYVKKRREQRQVENQQQLKHQRIYSQVDIDAALRRAKAEGLDEALKLCAVIENHYATKGKNVQVSDIQRHAVIGVRQSILDRIAELEQHAHTEPPSCLWTYDDIDDCYNTGCGNAYCLVDGTLEENDHKYCPYCGGPIQEDARAAQIEEGE